jgi:glycosyltransferase involved in cell wall biosynthesis
MSQRPEVSVVVPAYNRREVLARALRSLVGQTFRDWEALVVDDGSTDGTGDAVYSFSDPRLRVIRHPVRRGPAAARNTGMAASTGRIIAFLDSDDEWLPEKLRKQVEALAAAPTGTAVVYTTTLRHFGARTYEIPSVSARSREGDLFKTILRGTYVLTTPSAAVTREAIDAAGYFDESLPALEEWDLWLRLAKVCRFAHIPEPLTISHFTPGSLSADRLIFLAAKRLILRKHLRDFLKEPRALASALAGMARLRAGDILCRLRPETAGEAREGGG